DPAERSLAFAEQRADVGGQEAGIIEGPVEATLAQATAGACDHDDPAGEVQQVSGWGQIVHGRSWESGRTSVMLRVGVGLGWLLVLPRVPSQPFHERLQERER